MDAYTVEWEQLAALKQRIDDFDEVGPDGESTRTKLRMISHELSHSSGFDKNVTTIVIEQQNLLRVQFNQTRTRLVNRWGSSEIIQGNLMEANEVYHVRVCNYFRYIRANWGYIEELMMQCLVSEDTIDAPKHDYVGMRYEIQGQQLIFYEVRQGENVAPDAMQYRADDFDEDMNF